MKPLTPQAFVESCERARPTHHLFGWGSKDLGEMVAGLLAAIAERDARLARVEEWAPVPDDPSIVALWCACCEPVDGVHAKYCPLYGLEPYK